jgi:hypothetical protein
MNYQIITDLGILKEFVDWLPDLQKDETYYACLFARNEYCQHIVHIDSDKGQLKRFTTNKEKLIEKLSHLEIEVGKYILKGRVMPQEALACYITPNPRSMERAAKQALIKLANLITQPYSGYNPHQEVMSEIQKSPSRKIVFDIDLDTKSFPDDTWEYINPDAVTILQTRGGYHLLIHLTRIEPRYAKTWYNNIANLPGVDKASIGDQMIPIPGTYQGGFTPRLVVPVV